MHNQPLVSVIIPYHNGESFIRDTLESITKQTYNNWECLVIDDYSTHSANDICASFNDIRIKYYINDSNPGMANARNKGCLLAKGKYIALCDQDDISLPDRLLCQVNTLLKDKNLLLVGSWRKNFGNNNEELHHETNSKLIKLNLLCNSQFTNPSIMFRQSILKNNSLSFNQEMAPSDDYDFICNVSYLGKISNIPKVLLLYRIHDKQASNRQNKEIESKSNTIRINYINKILTEWIPLGLNVDEMANIFSKSHDFPIDIIQKNYLLWLSLNKKNPLWDDTVWNIFLGERLLLSLYNSKISKIKRLTLIKFFRKSVFTYLLKNKFPNGFKLLIKSILK